MNTRINYHQLAGKVNYTAIEKKLDQLSTEAPPKNRRSVADVLAPIVDRLHDLLAKGWTFPQLAKELNDAGLPIKLSALRAHLKKVAKSAR